jgi:D-alanyl-lipoteichoic acid acyltransferase DltB (MBOAT superfamily)
MLFNSYSFIFLFAPLAIVGLALCVRHGGARAGIVFLGAASLAFYAVGAMHHVPILVGSVVANFLIGQRIASSPGRGVAKAWLITGVAANLALLATFKYARFGAEALNQITGSALSLPDWALPIGISFYTFTQIAFLVDAYRGIATEKDGARYGLFVTYFPHLIAGPIIHHKQVIPQFSLERFGRFHAADVSSGLALFTIGLAKKVLVADQVAPFANAVFAAAAAREPLSLWEAAAGLLAYSMQIYFDFSAYSDMAIGLSRIMGVDLPLNFNAPYKARSIIEFWRRWHISLSTFLRDYLYIPLGGNRLGEVRRYLNLFVVMMLGGLWHGAGWGFVIWGGLHGAYLICNHAIRDLRLVARLPAVLVDKGGWGLTFLATTVAWAFFRADGPGSALYLLQSAAGAHGVSLPQKFGEIDFLRSLPALRFEGMFEAAVVTPVSSWFIPLAVALVLAVGAPTSTQLVGWLESGWREGAEGRVRSTTGAVILGILFGVCLLALHRQSPFLYFNF